MSLGLSPGGCLAFLIRNALLATMLVGNAQSGLGAKAEPIHDWVYGWWWLLPVLIPVYF